MLPWLCMLGLHMGQLHAVWLMIALCIIPVHMLLIMHVCMRLLCVWPRLLLLLLLAMPSMCRMRYRMLPCTCVCSTTPPCRMCMTLLPLLQRRLLSRHGSCP